MRITNIEANRGRMARLAGTAALAVLAWSHPALAQGGQASDEEAAEGNRGAIVVSASRSGEGVRADRLGASVTVIDAEALEQRQTRIVSDVLRDIPGLAVSRTGAVGGMTQVRVRGGEGNHVLVLIDGIEAADPYFGEFDFGTLLADPAARIEVLRGQQSSLYGSDAIGGVIHYMTLSGAEAPGVSLRAEAGSFETITAGARFAGVEGDLDYAFTGSYYHTGGYPTARGGTRDVGADIASLSGKLSWSPAESLKITGVGRYSHTRADNNNSENDPASPLFGYIVDSPGVYSRNDAFYGLISAEHLALDGRWSNSLTAQISDSARDGFGPYMPGGDPRGRTSGNEGQRLKGSFVSSILLGDDTLSHRLTGAVDAERERFRNTTPFPSAFQGRRQVENLGLVAQYELLWNDALSLGASIRHDDNDRFDDVTTYRVQGSYALATGTRLRGAYGTGVKNPGFFELFGYSDGRYIGNPNLRPEKSEGWEVGLEQSFGDNLGTVGVTYFDSRLKNEIYTDYPAPDFIATPDNRDTLSKQHGVEVFASARPLPQLRLDAAYTYLKARENGVEEVRRPKHVASFNATVFSADERFSGTVTARYNGRQVDDAFTRTDWVPVREVLDDYVLVNLSAEYKVTPRLALTGRVENLLDQEYEELFSFATAGISAYGGVQLRF